MYKVINNPTALLFRYLSISIVFMFIGFLVGEMFIPPQIVYYANIIIGILGLFFIVLALFSRKMIIPRSFSMNYVYLFTFIDGILMYPIFQFYLADLGTGVFLSIVAGTAIWFLILSFFSYKKESGYFFGFARYLLPALLALTVVSLINIFIGSPKIYIFLSLASVAIFSGYILYDVNLVKYEIENGYINSKNDLSIHILNLYLDFINILLDLLNLASFFDD